MDAGYAADQFSVPGSATPAMSMLDEGTAKRTSLEISEELAMLGARLSAGSNLDTSFVSLSALKDKLDPALAVYSDIILNPAFPEADFQRLQKLPLAQILQEKDSPIMMALRVFPKLVAGGRHPRSRRLLHPIPPDSWFLNCSFPYIPLVLPIEMRIR